MEAVVASLCTHSSTVHKHSYPDPEGSFALLLEPTLDSFATLVRLRHWSPHHGHALRTHSALPELTTLAYNQLSIDVYWLLGYKFPFKVKITVID